MRHKITGTIEYEGIKIDYTFTPGEPMVRYYKDGSGYPGSPDEIEFSCSDADIMERINKDSLFEEQLREAVKDDINDAYDRSERD